MKDGDRVTKKLVEIYEDLLAEEGFRPEVDGFGNVVFKFEGMTIFITVDETDPGYFRLVLPNFWQIENPDDHAIELEAINQVNMTMKAAKAVMVRFPDGSENISAAVETFLDNPDTFVKGSLARCAGILMGLRKEFWEHMQRLRGTSTPN